MSILFDNPLPAIGCGDPGDPIDFSCWIEGSYQKLSRIMQEGDASKWTFCAWVKNIGPDEPALMFSSGTASQYHAAILANTDIHGGNSSQRYYSLKDDRVYRDFSAWMFLLVNFDGSLPAADRYSYFVFDEQVSLSYSQQYGALGASTTFNTAVPHLIGSRPEGVGAINTESFVANPIFLSDIVATPGAFIYRNSHDVFVHKKYAGPFGVNGFHLDFADPLDLGKDVSGNGNHFTSTGLTAANQVTDTPTNNFATLNPIDASGNVGAGMSTVSGGYARSTMLDEGHFKYFEAIPASAPSVADWVGVVDAETKGFVTWYGDGHIHVSQDGQNEVITAGPAYAANDVIGVHYDFDAQTVEFTKGGVSQFSKALNFSKILPVALSSNAAWTLKFKEFQFGSADALEWSASNLPCPAILNPDDYFTIRQPIGGADVSDLPWDPTVHKTLCLSKCRDSGTDWRASDTVRGDNLAWSSNVGGLETACSLSFTPNGIAPGADTEYQGSRIDYFWRASPKSGFDIVEFTHVNGTPTTIAHAAGGVIEFAFVVPLDGGDIRIYHHEKPDDYAILNDTGYGTDAGWLSSTAVNITHATTRPSGRYIAYVWRGVPQFSSFSKYPGNGLADGSFVPADFLPRCIFLRRATSGVSSRAVLDDADRYEGNPSGASLYMDGTETEGTGSNPVDLVSNGAKLRVAGTVVNQSGVDHLFGAWAKTPGKFARAR